MRKKHALIFKLVVLSARLSSRRKIPWQQQKLACLSRNQGLWEYHLLKKWRALICKLQIIWTHAFYHLEKLPDDWNDFFSLNMLNASGVTRLHVLLSGTLEKVNKPNKYIISHKHKLIPWQTQIGISLSTGGISFCL